MAYFLINQVIEQLGLGPYLIKLGEKVMTVYIIMYF